jgi:gluconokinase
MLWQSSSPVYPARVKSEVGRAVAKGLGLKFLDTDDFHFNANKDKMHRGIALTDDDRLGWLKSLHEMLRQELDSGTSRVLACSALKRGYRGAIARWATRRAFLLSEN